MFLKILPDLDMPLSSLDTKNFCPRLNGLGDIAIIANPIFFWDALYKNMIHILFACIVLLKNKSIAQGAKLGNCTYLLTFDNTVPRFSAGKH